MTNTLQPEALDGRSLDISADKRQQLKAMFPSVFTETRNAEGAVVESIDFERLKAELGTFSEVFESRKERFGLDWPGKADCMKVIQQPSTGTLLPMRDESVNFDSSENLIIEGDNLEVLKLLQKSYYGKVKMIYIDPPYNTGNEFIYPDNFREGLDEYLRYSGQVDAEGRKQSANTETGGRYHSNWLSMMYPRLFLAKNLLREDGVIFVSIDDHEVHNLRLLMNEIFGEENFFAQIPWQSRTSVQNDTDFSEQHEYIVGYATVRRGEQKRLKESNAKEWFKLPSFAAYPKPLDEDRFSNPDNDSRGKWKADPFDAPNVRENLTYAIRNPKTKEDHWPPQGRCWRTEQPKYIELLRDNRIIFGRTGDARPQLKVFYEEKKLFGEVPTSWFDGNTYGTSTSGTQELQALFDGASPFTFPKPTTLLKTLIRLTTQKDDLVLDFFAGSGTTGHAVMDTNQNDVTARKFILVQLPEKIENKALKSIAGITRERVKRAGKKLANDSGFRAFKLAASNFKVWSSDPAKVTDLGKSLQLFADHVAPSRQAEDILYELLLKAGYPLTAAIDKLTLAGKEVFSISDGALLICLDRRLTLEVIDAMVARTPAMILCLDDGFRGNDQLKVNAVQTVKSRNQNDETDIVFRVV